MLKYYNELLQNTNFKLPPKHHLEFDQQVFRKTIDKICKAHKKEIDWVRNLCAYETKSHMEKRFTATSQILQDECSILLNQFDALKGELESCKINERNMARKMMESEVRISHMRLYIDEYKLSIQSQEDELSKPLQPGIIKSNKGMSPMVPEVMEQLTSGSSNSKIKPNIYDDEKKWPLSFLGLVHPTDEKLKPGERKKQAKDNNERFEKDFGSYFPKGPGGLYRDPSFINPYLKIQALDFYGAHVSLQVQDKTRVLENELIRDYQIRLQASMEEKEAALSEHRLIKKFFNEIRTLADARQEQIVDLKHQLQAKESQRLKEIADWQEKYEMDIDAIQTTFNIELEQCKMIFSCEVEVLTHICRMQQEDVIKNRVSMKQIATLLRIPRAHHKYIMMYGAYDFIEKCEDIVHNNDKVRIKERALEERAVQRQKVTLDRVKKQQRGQSVPLEIPMPKFYRDKEIEREKIQELMLERKMKAQELELQQKVEPKGKRIHNVSIDETEIDLYDTPDNVIKKITSAMNTEVVHADYALTEAKIDEMRLKNMNANEANPSIFTATLERFMNNVGLTLPNDSDPGFYKDHYDREVKTRQKKQGSQNEQMFVTGKINGFSSQKETQASNIRTPQADKKHLDKKGLNVQSGFTSQLTTSIEATTAAKSIAFLGQQPSKEQSSGQPPSIDFSKNQRAQHNSTGDIVDLRTSVQSINDSQNFNFTMRSIAKKEQMNNTQSLALESINSSTNIATAAKVKQISVRSNASSKAVLPHQTSGVVIKSSNKNLLLQQAASRETDSTSKTNSNAIIEHNVDLSWQFKSGHKFHNAEVKSEIKSPTQMSQTLYGTPMIEKAQPQNQNQMISVVEVDVPSDQIMIQSGTRQIQNAKMSAQTQERADDSSIQSP